MGPAWCLCFRFFSRAAPTPCRLEAAAQTLPGETLGCRHGASSVTISSTLPLWKNGSIEALKLISSSESTVEFKKMSQESRTGWHTGAGLHPPTLTTDGEAVQSCPAVYGGGSGGGNAIRSADPDWRMLPPPPPRGDVFIASFTALHKRQINNLEVSVYSPFTPTP